MRIFFFLFIFRAYCYSAKASEAVVKIATDEKDYRKCSPCVIVWIATDINNTVDLSLLMTMFTASYLFIIWNSFIISSVFFIIWDNNYESLKKSNFKAYDSSLRNCSAQKVDPL